MNEKSDQKIDADAAKYTEEEAQRRFEKLVKTALNTPPKPLKGMAPKGVPAQSKKGRNGAKRAA